MAYTLQPDNPLFKTESETVETGTSFENTTFIRHRGQILFSKFIRFGYTTSRSYLELFE